MLPVALSIVVTMVSSNTVLGVPSQVYRFGSSYVWYGVSGGIGFIFAGEEKHEWYLNKDHPRTKVELKSR